MRTALVIPDGIGIRNFLQEEFVEASGSEVTVLHTTHPATIKKLQQQYARGVQFRQLPGVKERPVPFTLRHALAYAHMYWADTRTMRYVRRLPCGGSWRTVLANRTARLLGRLAASSSGIHALEQTYFRSMARLPEMEEYRRLLQDIKPDVLFSSSQKSPKVLPAVLAAQSLGIPTAAFVASWDNITGKGRICAPFDCFLVWSNLMQKEILQFYPEISADSIHVVGSPQFDCYANPEILWSRETFFRHIGGDPSRPLICYSGGDFLTSPEDPQFVWILAEQLRRGQIRGNAQLFVRPCPVDQGDRYQPVLEAYPELLFGQPAWEDNRAGHFEGFVPSLHDTQFLANLTYHADINVNVASTMTLDFSLRDKPVVNVAFDAAPRPIRGLPVWDLFYHWEHYRPVVALRAARFARTPTQMAEHINAYLENPNLDAQGRRALVQLQLGVPLGSSSKRVAECLKSLAGAKRDPQSAYQPEASRAAVASQA